MSKKKAGVFAPIRVWLFVFSLRVKYSFQCLWFLLRGKIMPSQNVIELDLSREGLETLLKIKVAPAIEQFFKNASNGVFETSSKWLDNTGEGLDFYEKSETMSKLADRRQVIDNFGNGLISRDGSFGALKINVAPLRLVGASVGDGVVLKTSDLLSFEEMKQYINELKDWTKAFYENDLLPAKITGSITIVD